MGKTHAETGESSRFQFGAGFYIQPHLSPRGQRTGTNLCKPNEHEAGGRAFGSEGLNHMDLLLQVHF